jgi:predicted nucleic acid-binding protein
VTLVVDAGPLIALMDRIDPMRPIVRNILSHESGRLVLPAPITAEVDYMLSERLGRRARLAFLTDLAERRFEVVCLEPQEYELVLREDQRYDDLDVGLADLSVVVLAHRFRTHRILTFDERHFRALRPLDGGSFTLLPRDLDTADA